MDGAKIRVDTSRLPLVVQTHRVGYGSEDIEQMIKQYEMLFLTGQRYVLLVHSEPGAPVLNVSQRRRVAAWWKERSEVIKRANIASAIVLESPLLRGTMTALNWLVEPVTPQRAFASYDDALDYCLSMLEQAGLTPPGDVEDLRRRRRA